MPPVKKPKAKTIFKATIETEQTTPVVSGQLKKKLQKREKNEKPKRGIVFIKHLPHGFFEDQIRRYFEQFGDVTRLRLARSKTTGGSKGFAFVEFDVPEVAEVAAETMDNYLMFNKVVKATYIPPEQQHYNFFKTSVRKVKNKAGKPIYVSYKTADINRRIKKFNEWSDEAYQKRTANKQRRIKKLNEKYTHLGIDFSSIVTGSKETNKAEGKSKVEEKSENKTIKKNSKTASKDSKEKKGKKSKKIIELEDLLGTTLNDDSDDHDFELDSENDVSDDDDDDEPASKKKRNEEIDLKDLLGDTLNDDSDDSEYELQAEDDEQDEQEESFIDEEAIEEDDEEESSDGKNVKKQKKIKPTNKKTKKLSKPKLDHLEERIQRKKLEGGIKKPKKDSSKKAKIGKPKNAMQAGLAKELAQPKNSLKKAFKQQSKKTKK